MFLLDIRYDPKSSTITKWIKDGTVCKPVHEVFYPKIYVSGKPELLCLIASLPGVKDVCFEEKTTWLGSKPEKVISATIEPNCNVHRLVAVNFNLYMFPPRLFLFQN